MMPREIPDQALLHYMASQKFEVFLDLGFALLSPQSSCRGAGTSAPWPERWRTLQAGGASGS